MWICVIALSRYCRFNKIKLFFFSVLNKWWCAGISYISACQQWLGQACDLWPLTVKLTLPPVRCCAKCQERPLILSCSLVSCSVAEYLSCLDQCTYIPSSAQISLLQAVLHRGRPTYLLRQNAPSSNLIFVSFSTATKWCSRRESYFWATTFHRQNGWKLEL